MLGVAYAGAGENFCVTKAIRAYTAATALAPCSWVYDSNGTAGSQHIGVACGDVVLI